MINNFKVMQFIDAEEKVRANAIKQNGCKPGNIAFTPEMLQVRSAAIKL